VTPKAGDLVLAGVERIGQHTRIELHSGRRAPLFVGDEIIVAYGNRYAPDQFEGVVPDTLESCDLLAAGGIAARMSVRHGKMKRPTRIRPLGLLGDETGRVVNLADWALPPRQGTRPRRPLTIAVLGTSMNAGKTTTAAYLIRGLRNAGLRVGAAKVTGTGAGCDPWLMRDAGAVEVLDFTDAGYVSTYHVLLSELEEIFERLTQHLGHNGTDAIVIEVADGVFQEETAALIGSPVFQRGIDGVIFAAGDAMGAVAGADLLARREHLQVLAVSGALTASPLALRETAQASGLPVLDRAALESPEILGRVLSWLQPDRTTAEAL
jgi:hypothetical protein